MKIVINCRNKLPSFGWSFLGHIILFKCASSVTILMFFCLRHPGKGQINHPDLVLLENVEHNVSLCFQDKHHDAAHEIIETIR